MDDFDILLVPDWAYAGYDVYIRRQIPGGGHQFLQPPDGLPMIVAPDAGYMGEIKPFLKISEHTAQRLADALASKGIKTDTDAKLQGKIEVLERYIADLRKLLHLDGEDDG